MREIRSGQVLDYALKDLFLTETHRELGLVTVRLTKCMLKKYVYVSVVAMVSGPFGFCFKNAYFDVENILHDYFKL